MILQPLYFQSFYIIFVLITLLGSSSDANASEFFDDRERGWYWFEQYLEKENNKEDEGLLIKSPLNPEEHIAKFRAKMDRLKAKAIIEPSIENVASYIKIQKKALDMASKFGRSWKLALLEYPELTDLSNPVNNEAINIAYKDKKKIDSEKIKLFAEEFGLIFFFSPDCSYCHAFVPVLKKFQEMYDFSVMAVTQSDGVIEGFAVQKNEPLVKQFNITHYPSIFAYSPKRNLAMPIGYGYLSIDELERNINYVIGYLQEARK